MVLAILEGRKTQTRRSLNPQPDIVDVEPKFRKHTWALWSDSIPKYRNGLIVECPYGQPGDRLWVRETFQHFFKGKEKGACIYLADAGTHRLNACSVEHAKKLWPRWTPSIFMPRWASRITLEIVNVRVERLQDISEEDAKSEGVEFLSGLWRDYQLKTLDHFESARESYQSLWNSINGKKHPWKENPWVWVLTFKKNP
jgi:hypothetical protein